MATGLSAATGLLVIAVVCWGIAGLVRRGQLARNGAVGIRTKATRASDEAWDAGHRAALPLLRLVAIVGVAGAVLDAVVGVALRHGNRIYPGLCALVTYACVLGLFVPMTKTADDAARAADRR